MLTKKEKNDLLEIWVSYFPAVTTGEEEESKQENTTIKQALCTETESIFKVASTMRLFRAFRYKKML